MLSAEAASDSPLAVGWGFLLLWVGASTVGWGVGGPVGVALSSSKDIIVTGYVGMAVGGILAGVLQWLVLRPQVAAAGWWVLTGVVAVAVVGLMVFAVGGVNADVGWVLGVVLLGTLLGVLQWQLLRGQFSQAGWWVLASTVGWVAGGPAAGYVGSAVGAALGPGWAVLGAVYGAITGPVLVWLLRQ